MPSSSGWLKYSCENDACAGYGKHVEVPRGQDADCPICGWTMIAVGR